MEKYMWNDVAVSGESFFLLWLRYCILVDNFEKLVMLIITSDSGSRRC